MNLNYFKEIDFFSALNALFEELNIPVNGGIEEPTTAKEILKDTYKDNNAFSLVKDVHFVGMVDDAAFEGGESLSKDEIKADYEGLLIFGIILNQREGCLLPTRSQLAEISRAFNREFYYTPVVLVFKYQDDKDNYLALSNTERLTYKQEWREGEKAGKVSLLRDINIDNTHSGHQQILANMSIKGLINSFDSLYKHWQKVFSVSLLNKRFYEELSNWYFWAVKEVTFPSEPTMHSMFEATGESDEKKLQELKQEHNAKNVIRLLTRLLFVWFIKEKKLIPDELFDLKYIKDNILEDLSPLHNDDLFESANTNSHYYKAILQNLFFATLNQEVGKRSFRNDKQHMNVTNLMRYQSHFKNPEKYIDLVESKVPFMNGGLFECLDKPHPTKKGIKGGDFIVYKDGFSDRDDVNVVVPDYLFFGVDEQVDISSVIGISNKETKQAAVKGLINIFNSYKFTISENTPIEEDIALDPELLGKVFENLLASYNPETKTTARKQSGSFYTPREIVNYMVDESLISYLKNTIFDWGMQDSELDKSLHELLSFDNINPFKDSPNIQKQIIEALDKSTILDPACGSGAFPMGVLQKMVHVLDKVDPQSSEWNQRQINKVYLAIESLEGLDDDKFREQGVKDLKEQIKDMEDAFENNELDYGRKLFLIENCIFGVDIQPIAIQISKLRFFISLIVDQKIDKNKENFGIRPLPNLETKFVAANTLIGIDIPIDLFDKKEVIKLEKDLKKVRHKLFSSKVPKRKRELRIEDKNLREKITELLEDGGMENTTARQLAAWDPYDQNTYSSFFDVEWMFDIKDGFDIVIGNPPYIDSEGMINSGQGWLREYISKKYKYTKGNWDMYIAFFEVGFLAVKNKGIVSYITPDKWLTKPFGREFRKYSLKFITHLLRSGRDVFESVGVDSIVTIFSKQNSLFFRYLDSIDHVVSDIKKDIIKQPYQLDIVFSKNLELILDITSNNDTVQNIEKLSFENACATSDCYILKDILHDNKFNELYKENDYYRVINTGTIDKYNSRWGKKSMTYLKDKYLNPIVLKKEFHTTFRNSYGDKALASKLIIKSLTLLDATIDSNGDTIPGKSTLILRSENIDTLMFISAILNSTFALFYIKERYSASSYNTGVNFTKDMLNNLPYPSYISNEFKNTIIILVKVILFSPSEMVSIVKNILNMAIFELYFYDHMKELEIDIVQFIEKDINVIMKNNKFDSPDSLDSNQKEMLIHDLNSIWSDSNGEVLKRINSFTEKSPDILKVIIDG